MRTKLLGVEMRPSGGMGRFVIMLEKETQTALFK